MVGCKIKMAVAGTLLLAIFTIGYFFFFSISWAELSERSKVELAFESYSKIEGGEVKIDGAVVINAIRALDLNPTIALINSLGGTETKGEVSFTFDDFYKIYLGVKEDKNTGGFHDFVECLKIYDIQENGTMKLADLTHMLLNLGERVTNEELDVVMQNCMLEEEDDDGNFPYMPFLCRLCDKPVPKDFKPQ